MSWYLLAAIPVFALMVIVHELGHFLTAKWAGIRVEEFAIGFPPRIASIKRGETTYSINALPIGGYVKMPGENGETVDEHGNPDPRTFGAKSAGKRAIVLVAGVTMNVILAIVLFSIAEAVGQVQFRPVVGSVTKNAPAAMAGMKAGDTILTVDGHSIKYFSDLQNWVGMDLSKAPSGAKSAPVVLVVRHAGASDTVTLTVNALISPPAGQGPMGISADENNPFHLRPPIWQAPALGVQDIGKVFVGTVDGVHQIIRGVIPLGKAVTGPVGIVQTTGQFASEVPIAGWYPILFLAAFLSLNLAFVNLLPIPGLDGGRLLLIGIEVLRRGKRLSPEREALVNLIGVGALLFLVLLVTINDVSNLGH